MKLKVNGKAQEFSDSISIGDFVKNLNIRTDALVIELNEKIVKRDFWQSTALSEGDSVELVSFVGGG